MSNQSDVKYLEERTQDLKDLGRFVDLMPASDERARVEKIRLRVRELLSEADCVVQIGGSIEKDVKRIDGLLKSVFNDRIK